MCMCFIFGAVDMITFEQDLQEVRGDLDGVLQVRVEWQEVRSSHAGSLEEPGVCSE